MRVPFDSCAVSCAFLCAVGLSACPSGSLIGEPCSDGGKEVCEDTVLIRCDGQVYVKLADCASQCIEGKDPVDHTGGIDANETWTCAEGPHVVKETMTVGNDATLTIEPGAVVRLVPASRINTLTAGRVVAKGTPNATILVTSDTGEAASFGGLTEGGINVVAVQDGEPSHIEHVIIERGIHGLGVFGLSSVATAPTVKNNTFRDNENYGIVLQPCGEADPPIPDFVEDGNQFFRNGAGDVSPCELP